MSKRDYGDTRIDVEYIDGRYRAIVRKWDHRTNCWGRIRHLTVYDSSAVKAFTKAFNKAQSFQLFP